MLAMTVMAIVMMAMMKLIIVFLGVAGFGEQGVRRRPVVARDEQGERILTMLSQLDVVNWLTRRRKELGPAFSNITIQHVVEVRL
jgi:hypothetical protein